MKRLRSVAFRLLWDEGDGMSRDSRNWSWFSSFANSVRTIYGRTSSKRLSLSAVSLVGRSLIRVCGALIQYPLGTFGSLAINYVLNLVREPYLLISSELFHSKKNLFCPSISYLWWKQFSSFLHRPLWRLSTSTLLTRLFPSELEVWHDIVNLSVTPTESTSPNEMFSALIDWTTITNVSWDGFRAIDTLEDFDESNNWIYQRISTE